KGPDRCRVGGDQLRPGMRGGPVGPQVTHGGRRDDVGAAVDEQLAVGRVPHHGSILTGGRRAGGAVGHELRPGPSRGQCRRCWHRRGGGRRRRGGCRGHSVGCKGCRRGGGAHGVGSAGRERRRAGGSYGVGRRGRKRRCGCARRRRGSAGVRCDGGGGGGGRRGRAGGGGGRGGG